jgi:deazaflavin-dependent oxidoreductase (nitroreductase family)
VSYLVLGGAVVLALALIYRVLKAAHARPDIHTRHSHGPVEQIVLGAVTKFLRASLRLGVHFGPMMMLTVAGRKSGLPRTNPVDLWDGRGHRYLVATHTATAAWVRNLRSAGVGVLWRGRERWTFTATELPLTEGGAVIRDVLVPRMRRPLAGFVLRQTVRVPPEPTPTDYLDIARDHPVFEVTLTKENSVNTRPRTIPAILIGAGLLILLAHLTLGLGNVLSTSQWVSGAALGLLVAGAGNHVRIFGRRRE